MFWISKMKAKGEGLKMKDMKINSVNNYRIIMENFVTIKYV